MTISIQHPDERPAFTRRRVLKLGGALASTAFAVPTILSACGGTNSLTGGASDKTLRVYWNAGHAYQVYKKVIEQFEQDHQGWKVKLELYQWPDLRTKLMANFQANDTPDLVEEPGGWVQEFGLTGKLRSLQDFINKDKQSSGFPDDWQDYTVQRNTVNGEVYGVQLHLTCTLCFYNTEMFEKAGIKTFPTTWDDFLAACKELTGKGVYGVALNQDAGYAWPWFLQNGARIYDPEKKVLDLDNERAFEALQFQSDLIHKHKVAPVPVATGSYDGPQKLFSARRAAIILTGPWDIKPILEGSKDLKWNIAQALKQQTQATTAAGSSVMIPKAAKNPEMAWELLKRLVALDVELAATKEARMTMPRKSWGNHPDVKQMDLIAPFGQGLTYAQFSGAELEKTGKSGTINDLFNKAYQDVIYKQRPAADALKEFVATGNKALS
ncbi:multiple sugar transport system substrate-binding protein [Thermosporothrix hazakensis]|jgi:multiple sugar transport system substrate-binding protein|uniref:Multiple sugar transport system substrate-binding protein n=1 Tax=Thermosporothrix hazakensis TaxID=644383 RepID=A0A326U278_THEHA|nr:sugar ABC transporter substrate-binding protein [Thermosporothrix hazakensis]PZW19333.1 multiple sugar transport system substrate-binding protein [Thermosporothrix hazakensis]GCE48229.1 hypothetical protein KTH_30980 [Thermosporothrix hazakensis]